MECACKWVSRRPAPVLRPGDRDSVNLEDGFPPAAAADRRFSGCSDRFNGPGPQDSRPYKLHLGIDGDGYIIASALTDSIAWFTALPHAPLLARVRDCSACQGQQCSIYTKKRPPNREFGGPS